MQIKVKKLHTNAILPTYATDGSACFDLHAILIDSKGEEYEQKFFSGTKLVIRTGLSFEIPDGYSMMIYSRSGHGFKNDIRLSNCVGVIDSDYRGEVMVKLSSDLIGYVENTFTIRNGDRIAQAMIIPVPKIELVESDELTDTSRGVCGFGSTGV